MVLGLAVQSGGTLVLSSAPDQGTSVNLWFPIAAETPAPVVVSADAPAPVVAFVARTILVVDDDALPGMRTAAMLEDLGHTTIEVMSGAKLPEADTPRLDHGSEALIAHPLEKDARTSKYHRRCNT